MQHTYTFTDPTGTTRNINYTDYDYGSSVTYAKQFEKWFNDLITKTLNDAKKIGDKYYDAMLAGLQGNESLMNFDLGQYRQGSNVHSNTDNVKNVVEHAVGQTWTSTIDPMKRQDEEQYWKDYKTAETERDQREKAQATMSEPKWRDYVKFLKSSGISSDSEVYKYVLYKMLDEGYTPPEGLYKLAGFKDEADYQEWGDSEEGRRNNVKQLEQGGAFWGGPEWSEKDRNLWEVMNYQPYYAQVEKTAPKVMSLTMDKAFQQDNGVVQQSAGTNGNIRSVVDSPVVHQNPSTIVTSNF